MRGVRSGHLNQTAGLFTEYMRRKQLKEIGFVDNFSTLPHWKAEAFAIIGEELIALEKKEAKRKQPKPGGGRRG